MSPFFVSIKNLFIFVIEKQKIMIKQFIHILFACFILSACTTVEQTSIDYMIPGKYNFSSSIHKVGIINNVTNYSDRNYTLVDSTHNFIYHEYSLMQGNGTQTANAMAQNIADQHYFDQVVICDSALRQNDSIKRITPLTQDEVQSLANGLNVDMLLSLENIWISTDRKIFLDSSIETPFFRAITQSKVYPVVRIYIPQKGQSIASIILLDSIYFDQASYELPTLKDSLICNDSILSQASKFAGDLTKQLLPYWKTEPRYFFSNSMDTDQKTAASLAEEGNWKKAEHIWKKQYDTSKGMKKAYTAYNIALSKEITDHLNEAIKWLKDAKYIALKVKSTSNKNRTIIQMIEKYEIILDDRMSEFPQLKQQMQKFNDEK